MRLRFTFISLGVGWKRGAVLRRLAKTKTRKKVGKSAVLRSWRFCGVCLSAGRARPVDHLSLLHVLDKPSLAQRIYRLSDGGDCPPPGVCPRRGWRHDAHCDLHGAYFGEYVQPPPREVEGEAEKPHASVPAEVFGDGVYQPVHKEEVCGPGGGAVWVEAGCPVCGGCA